MLVLPGVPDEHREGADQAEDREPPDVPDHREAADRGEEGKMTPVGVSAASRSAGRPAPVSSVPVDRQLFAVPIGLLAVHVGKHREIVMRRW